MRYRSDQWDDERAYALYRQAFARLSAVLLERGYGQNAVDVSTFCPTGDDEQAWTDRSWSAFYAAVAQGGLQFLAALETSHPAITQTPLLPHMPCESVTSPEKRSNAQYDEIVM